MTRLDPLRIRLTICAVLTAITALAVGRACSSGEGDVRYEPSPPAVVQRMLELGQARRADVMYDLGSGDGRLVIAAARDFGVERAVGVEIDAELVARARTNAEEAGVAGRARFVQADLFEFDFSDADLVTLFLLPRLNLRLRPRLLAELEPGTRIVSHEHDMGDWEPDASTRVDGHEIHQWIVPARVEGEWRATSDDTRYRLALQQLYAGVSGTLDIGERHYVIANAQLRGRWLRFEALPAGGADGPNIAFEGRIEDDRLRGTLRIGDARIDLGMRRAG